MVRALKGEIPHWLASQNIYRLINDLVLEQFRLESGLSDHHALHDALGNQFAYRAKFGKQCVDNQADVLMHTVCRGKESMLWTDKIFVSRYLAALQGKTIKQCSLEKLFPGDADANQAWKELQTLLGTRIHDGLAGNVSTKTICEIVDEELAEGPGLTGYVLTAAAESDLRGIVHYARKRCAGMPLHRCVGIPCNQTRRWPSLLTWPNLANGMSTSS